MKKLILVLLVVSFFGCEKDKFKECHCANDGVINYIIEIEQENQKLYNSQVTTCLQFDNCTLIK